MRKITVLGAGRVGYGVAKALSIDEMEISVVDESPAALWSLADKLDIKPVLGHAADIDILRSAGLEDADVLIAVTSSDEVNITACQIADFMFKADTKIARVNRRMYFTNGHLFEKGKFSVDFAVSPQFEVARIIKRNISVPGVLDIVSCVDDKLRVIGIVCKPGAQVVNVPLKYLASVAKELKICILYTKGKDAEAGLLPGSRDTIMAGDTVYLVCMGDDIQSVTELFGYTNNEKNNVVLIGGNELCLEILETTLADDVSIKIIEHDLGVAEKLYERLNNIEILHGSPLDAGVLEMANLHETNVVISMTSDDKTNIISCLLSKKLGARRTSAVLNDISYSNLLYSLGISSILDARSASIAKILHYIRREGIEDVVTLEDGAIEVLAFEVTVDSHVVGTLVATIASKNNVCVAAIVRGENVFMFPKKMLISAGDMVLFIIRKESISRILKLFQEKPKYLA
ncbi:MAG: Trk system potassium transporter TrkA [Holosporales bacterium]|jgi:trk system potassium uptake protein TrkA|nr:Trk system potassium transporter TrkA [Holosporales bacterium]